MSENISSYKLNLLKKKELDQQETLKENPIILEERDQRERELTQKRIKDRKVLDIYYKNNIETNKKQKYEIRKLEQSEAINSLSFINRLNDK